MSAISLNRYNVSSGGSGEPARQWFKYHQWEGADVSTSSYLTKGFLIEPTTDIALSGIGIFTDEGTSKQFVLRLYQLNDTTQVGSALHESAVFNGTGSPTFFYSTFPKITLAAGNRYVVALSNTTAGETIARVGSGTSTEYSFYDRVTGFNGVKYARINNANPGAGAAWDITPTTSSPYYGGVLIDV